MAIINRVSHINHLTDQFARLRAEAQIAILCACAQKIQKASKTAKPSALFSQKVHSVLQQLNQVPRDEQIVVLEDILRGLPTRLAEAYDELDTNMRMAFWYRLAISDRINALLAPVRATEFTAEETSACDAVDALDSNELISFLRAAVCNTTPAYAAAV